MRRGYDAAGKPLADIRHKDGPTVIGLNFCSAASISNYGGGVRRINAPGPMTPGIDDAQECVYGPVQHKPTHTLRFREVRFQHFCEPRRGLLEDSRVLFPRLGGVARYDRGHNLQPN